MMKAGVCAVLLSAMLSAPVSAQTRLDAEAARARFGGFVEDIGQPGLRLVIADAALKTDGGAPTIVLAPAALATVRTPQELDAVFGVLVVDLASPRRDPRGSRPTVGDYAGLAAFAAAASALDPIDPRDPRNWNDKRQGAIDLNDPRRSPKTDSISPRGRLLLGLLQRSKSCTGAAMDALARFPRDPALAGTRYARLGAQTRLDLGAAALPPDRSCLG